MRAELELECINPDVIIKAIKPDASGNVRFSAELKAAKKSIKLTVESKDATGLLAGINSYVRLIKTATDMEKLED